MSTTIDIKALAKTYPAIGKAGITRAVDGVTLTINPGELFFLLGPSGCGKTTLLRMIAGFIEPTEGSIAFNKNDITHTPPNKRNTGMVFQSYALWPHMTIAQNVAFGLGVRKVPAAEKATRVKEALAQVHMTGYESRKPTQLSGGQQQRVALARALVVRPAVLLLDEPLSNLDAKLRLELRSQIRKVCKDAGLTTVYVTHDQKEALSMADRVAIMRDGKVVQVGTPRELYRQPRSRFVAEFLGEADFLDATIAETTDTTLHLDTPAGRLTAAIPPTNNNTTPHSIGDKVTICIRPECWKLGPANTGTTNTKETSEHSGGRAFQPALMESEAVTSDLLGHCSESPNNDTNNTTTLTATLAETTYLGELAQHTLDLPNNTRIHASVLNPALAPTTTIGDTLTISTNPEDVIVLPHNG